MTQLNHAATADDGLVSIHPRRLTIAGDGQPGNPSVLVLDGKPLTRVRKFTVFTGLSAAGAATLSGSVVGDMVLGVIDSSAFTDVSSSFESVITVAGQIQETASVSGHTCFVLLGAQSVS